MAGISEADLKEPHQIKLSKYLAAIPPFGTGEVRSIMPGSQTLKTPFTQKDLDDLKGVVSSQIFTDYTGYTHMGLLKKWLTDRTTTCNEFCSHCGTAMGFKAQGDYDGVGRFDIADYLTRYGKGHCWVPADSGSKPEYGDVFRIFEAAHDQNGMARNHMGVSLFVDGDTWHTVESGQGGPSSGSDAIKRKQTKWMPGSVKGWVNMKALLSAGNLIPNWLGGWWEVEEEPYSTWYYYFGVGGKVSCSTFAPTILSQPPLGDPLIGNYTMTGMFTFDISWQSGDVDESFTAGLQLDKKRTYTMSGKIKSSAVKFSGKRMMITGLL